MAQAEAALKCPATDAMLTPSGVRWVAAVPVQHAARVRVHQLPNRSRAAVRTGPMRLECPSRRAPLYRLAGNGAVTVSDLLAGGVFWEFGNAAAMLAR